ncbi:uncharacterized protein At4g02000-like [Raphanus sativus]|uniref:Uncharacterized protein At4g02000-like n=1 Tax=Raphanus sativus TaxID=3726 RepID=A0A9W3BV51_RAPSA|nr:uncharacterized protein At4g02000-like [Raphanus sativus]
MDHQRFTAAEKGKDIMTTTRGPQRKRIRASAFDNSTLLLGNALTLIGRLTNSKEQSITRNYFFQFRFQEEEDLQRVLSNRPYHSKHWTLILQPWEPVISASFPSQIPFWIQLKGLLLHYWHAKMIDDIPDALGTLEGTDISSNTVRMRLLLNGLEPLVMETIVKFSEGEEALVTLEYEELENFCSICHSLTHAALNCIHSLEVANSTPREYAPNRGNEIHSSKAHSQRRDSPGRSRSTYRSHRSQEKRQTPSFNQRLDRNGRPFGERVFYPSHQVKPLKNKIAPSYTVDQPARRRTYDIPSEG